MERTELGRMLGAAGQLPANQVAFIAERNPGEFMRRFAAAIAGSGPIFLGDPGWGRDQQPRWQPTVDQTPDPERGWLMIPTGGSGGGLKFVRHDQETLTAAVSGFCRHFAVTQVNAIGVLPLYHVSGLMSWIRSAVTGGEYRPWAWKALEAGERPKLGSGRWMISLVPTQLQRLLEKKESVDWLRGFDTIFVGGGPAWATLAEAGAAAGLRLSLSYGMTETAAMVTALRPEEFLAGNRSSGKPLPHATLGLAADGVLTVRGDSVCRGYYPGWRDTREFETGDLGRIDEHGFVHVLGRRDAAIISGGKKIYPNEVEAALRASGEFEDIVVIGLPDPEWGEIVVACYPEKGKAPDLGKATAGLAGFQKPKRFVALRDWPRNAQGKINRMALRGLVEAEDRGRGTEG